MFVFLFLYPCSLFDYVDHHPNSVSLTYDSKVFLASDWIANTDGGGSSSQESLRSLISLFLPVSPAAVPAGRRGSVGVGFFCGSVCREAAETLCFVEVAGCSRNISIPVSSYLRGKEEDKRDETLLNASRDGE